MHYDSFRIVERLAQFPQLAPLDSCGLLLIRQWLGAVLLLRVKLGSLIKLLLINRLVEFLVLAALIHALNLGLDVRAQVVLFRLLPTVSVPLDRSQRKQALFLS